MIDYARNGSGSTLNDTDRGFTHGYQNIGDITIHYVSVGDGPAVLLIPGWPQTWYVWRHILPMVAAAGFRGIAVDPRGLGQSSRPTTGYDTGQVAADLHALMTVLGYDRYAVVGHDIGMWIGYALANDAPHAVGRLAVMEAVIPGLAEAPQIFVPQNENVFLWHFMFNQLADLPEMLIQGREREYLSWLLNQWSYLREEVAVDAYIEAYSVPGALRGGFSYYRAIPETIAQNRKRAQHQLQIPVLALGAEHATKDAPLATMKKVAVDVRGGILPGCGHFVPEECPNVVLGHLLPFLRDGD